MNFLRCVKKKKKNLNLALPKKTTTKNSPLWQRVNIYTECSPDVGRSPQILNKIFSFCDAGADVGDTWGGSAGAWSDPNEFHRETSHQGGQVQIKHFLKNSTLSSYYATTTSCFRYFEVLVILWQQQRQRENTFIFWARPHEGLKFWSKAGVTREPLTPGGSMRNCR